jgi:hypothetical protein
MAMGATSEPSGAQEVKERITMLLNLIPIVTQQCHLFWTDEKKGYLKMEEEHRAEEAKVVEQDRWTTLWVYVLELVNGYFYIGKTQDLVERMTKHFCGGGSKLTARHRPRRLVEVYRRCSAYCEDEIAARYIGIHGADRVEGGIWNGPRGCGSTPAQRAKNEATAALHLERAKTYRNYLIARRWLLSNEVLSCLGARDTEAAKRAMHRSLVLSRHSTSSIWLAPEAPLQCPRAQSHDTSNNELQPRLAETCVYNEQATDEKSEFDSTEEKQQKLTACSENKEEGDAGRDITITNGSNTRKRTDNNEDKLRTITAQMVHQQLTNFFSEQLTLDRERLRALDEEEA